MPEDKEKSVVQEKEIISWSAPSRPFKKRSREFYVKIISVACLVGLIMFLIDGFMPVILIVSIVFLLYVMSTVEPETISYSITNLGVKVHNQKTPWSAMGRFWFTKRFDSELLVIETASLPGRLEFVMEGVQKETVKKTLEKYIVFEEYSPSAVDKASSWFSKTIRTS